MRTCSGNKLGQCYFFRTAEARFRGGTKRQYMLILIPGTELHISLSGIHYLRYSGHMSLPTVPSPLLKTVEWSRTSLARKHMSHRSGVLTVLSKHTYSYARGMRSPVSGLEPSCSIDVIPCRSCQVAQGFCGKRLCLNLGPSTVVENLTTHYV